MGWVRVRVTVKRVKVGKGAFSPLHSRQDLLQCLNSMSDIGTQDDGRSPHAFQGKNDETKTRTRTRTRQEQEDKTRGRQDTNTIRQDQDQEITT